MIIPVSYLIFYREVTEIGISGDWPTCDWLGCCESKEADKTKEDCFEASVDFLRWAISPKNKERTLKVIYTDLWRFSKEELFNQVTYTSLVNFEN